MISVRAPYGIERQVPKAPAMLAPEDRCTYVVSMNDRIVIDPKVCHGAPVIRATRTPVAIVVGSLAGGMSFDELQREYDLTIDDIRAALKFASELVKEEQHHSLPT
jgi:uncharacterized protein (DUF433 family)